MNSDDELNPIVHSSPESHTGNEAEQEPVLGNPFPRQSVQQRSDRDGREKRQVEAWMNQEEENAAKQRESVV